MQQSHQSQNNNLGGSQGNGMDIEDKNDGQATHYPGK